jgi:hypothetical protein
MAQDQEQRQQENSVNILGGLNTDSSLVNQPQGTTRFVMTGVDETREGDLGFISNEESNQQCYELPLGYIPIGQVYIGDETKALFLVNSTGDSMIATLDKECNLTVAVTDESQAEKLGFNIGTQIDATFRLRRGCERTVYWVDPKPRLFVFDKPEEFQNSVTGDWEISKFNLFKSYQSIPVVTDIEVVDGAGQLAPGSYNFSIRYLDADFNPTEFVTSTETVMIYNSPLNTEYKDIRGATKETNGSYLNFSNSNKAIKITLDPNSLDITFPFYQIAITEANSGNGLVSDTKYTQEISTRDTVFYYTGVNFETQGTQEEVTTYNQIIEKATSIEQIENRLILGDVEGKQVNFCKLQKYASQITSDVVTKEVFLNSVPVDDANSKDPAAHFNGLGYMPGEIYSFGIVYIFADNSLSPVFHIPGKGPSVPSNLVYTTGNNVYGMPSTNNSAEDSAYIDNATCGQDLFWGTDYKGLPLTNQPVRHHRFPLRTDYGLRFVQELTGPTLTTALKFIQVEAIGVNVTVPTICPGEGEQYYNASCVNTFVDFHNFDLTYTDGTSTQHYIESVELDDFAATAQTPPVAATENVNIFFNSGPIPTTTLGFIGISEVIAGVTNPPLAIAGSVSSTSMDVYTTVISPVTNLKYKITISESSFDTESKQYVTDIMGIKFSNIVKPSIADTNGQDIIGYYIVRNERTEEERTILDSAVIMPTLKNKHFVSQGLLYPELNPTSARKATIKEDIFGLLIPEHKFNNKVYNNFTSLIQQGDFVLQKRIRSLSKINDVSPGTSYRGSRHKDSERDSDGFSLHVKTRDNHTKFSPSTTLQIDFNSDIKEVFYLNALGDKVIEDSSGTSHDVFNLAADNKIGIMSLKNNKIISPSNLPYAYLYRENKNPYSNFRLDPYYKESKNPHYFPKTNVVPPQTCEIFNGDSYINPIRYTNSIFYENRVRYRVGQTSVMNYVGAFFLAVAAVAILFIPGVGIAGSIALGTLAAGLVGVATSLVLSGIEQDAWNKAYDRLYKEGLRDTISDHYLLHDRDTVSGYERGFWKNPEDDEIQWLGDCANLWFESSVNMGLRHGSSDGTPDFLGAPGDGEPGTRLVEWEWEFFGTYSVGSGSSDVPPTSTLDNHMVRKLTYFDIERKSSKAYIGLPAAEMYLLNPDYTRRNKQKSFFHLGLEYDCCTDCVETFPHRWHWSEQAFQEELTDNFRMFLPNNYKDLEGETGRITDIFRVQNNLYVHTEEGLWYCPQTFQERVTADVISFIGTGEYFSIPPRKMVDDNNSSAGNKHKWARTKTKFGVLFPSYKEKKWYLFNGEQLQPISDKGNYSWFLQNMDFKMLNQYYNANSTEYPYNNNPSNLIGIGYLSTYDTAKERLIITKKDFEITNLPTSDYELCSDGTTVTLFSNISQTIGDRESDGWTYLGIENCSLKFIKSQEVETTITNSINIWHPPVTQIIPLDPECENIVSVAISFTIDDPEETPSTSVTATITNCLGVEKTATKDLSYAVEGDTGTVLLLINSCVILGEDYSNIDITIADPGVTIGDYVVTAATTNNCYTTSITPGYWTKGIEEEIFISYQDVIEYEQGTEFELSPENFVNHSWTMSYSLKRQEWRSWHPYLPDFYMHVQNKFYSWKNGLNHLYKHNVEGSYQTFYGIRYPFIVEFVDNPSAIINKVWDNVLFQSEAKVFNPDVQDYYDVKDVTFNKAILYNTHQISGLLNLVPKANGNSNYLLDQTKNSLIGDTPLDRNERDWTFNSFRDLRDDYTVPMFMKEASLLQSNYYIDKIINPAAIDYNKDWTQLESFRDKFLVVRLIFDTFADKKLIFNFSALDKKISER